MSSRATPTDVANYASDTGNDAGKRTNRGFEVAINDSEFLVLERNNRGLGVDGTLASPNKKVFRIDLA